MMNKILIGIAIYLTLALIIPLFKAWATVIKIKMESKKASHDEKWVYEILK